VTGGPQKTAGQPIRFDMGIQLVAGLMLGFQLVAAGTRFPPKILVMIFD
jgi:hypothetical protein